MRARWRFSPACAGNTPTRPSRRPMPSVQPRVCGEHTVPLSASVRQPGSAPRVRGTRPIGVVVEPELRFSPACAGNTERRTDLHLRTPVQPRVCGEHASGRLATMPTIGSAPRVRGTLRRAAVVDRPRRFSPACAGNTGSTTIRSTPSPVQPRVCGEHRGRLIIRAASTGSAPRVRGTRRDGALSPQMDRFSPACAGNTRGRRMRAAPSPVQPRVCGEHHGTRRTRRRSRGSAPRVRGTRAADAEPPRDHRFSPACAGNTRAVHPPPVHGSVQPRVCGEHTEYAADIILGRGSAPRVRGTRPRRRRPRPGMRFSPACAGNTRRR